jgi:hypothetical protein
MSATVTATAVFSSLRAGFVTTAGFGALLPALLVSLGAGIELSTFAGVGTTAKRFEMASLSAGSSWYNWTLWRPNWLLSAIGFLLFSALGTIWSLYWVVGSVTESFVNPAVTTTTLGDLFIANNSLLAASLVLHTISEQLFYRAGSYGMSLLVRIVELVAWVAALITVIVTCSSDAPVAASSEYGGVLIALIITQVLVAVHVIFVSTPRIIALYQFGGSSDDLIGASAAAQAQSVRASRAADRN